MTKQEMILFGEAITLLRKAKFHYNKHKEERDIVVEKIQNELIVYASNLLANNSNAEKN